MLSRAAENLYWMGRYVERAEHTLRLVSVHLNLLVGTAEEVQDDRAWLRLFAALHRQPAMTADSRVDTSASLDLLHDLTFNRSNSSSISTSVANARENARALRAQLSSELWEQLNTLYLSLNARQNHNRWHEEPHSFYREIENGAYLFQGLVLSSIPHDEGWFFVQVGVHLERALSICSLLDAHYRVFPLESENLLSSQDYLQLISLLRASSSFEAYCRVIHPQPAPHHVAEFLLLDSHLPRSIRFNIEQMAYALEQIAKTTQTRRARHLNRIAGRLRANLTYSDVDEVLATGLHAYLQEVMDQCEQIHTALYNAYIAYPVEEVFAK